MVPVIASSPRLAALAERTSFPDGPVHCAVSGGADSLALFALAVHRFGAQAVTAWHVDHGLRPESTVEGDLVERLARDLGAQIQRRTVSIAEGPNLEARARLARYAALPDSICTGHTADDVAESVVMNLLRGAGFDGMSPMQRTGSPRVGQTVHRPIIGLRRSDTVALCAELGWTPAADSMNNDPRYVRTRVRHDVLPLLDDVAGRDVTSVLARSAEVAADDVAVLDGLAAELDPTDARALAVAPVALARRALRHWFVSVGVDPDGHPPTLAALDRAMAVARGEAIACEVGFGWRLARSSQRLALVRQPQPRQVTD